MEKKIKAGTLASWESIKKLYPDSFVLLEQPEYSPKPHLQRGIFRYKNKNKKKVYEMGTKLNIGYSTVQYTGGKRLDELDENLLLL